MKLLKMIQVSTFLTVVAVMMNGCLASQYKEYRYQLKKDGTGTGSIRFINIVSQEDEGKDVSEEDFEELIDNYIEGTSFEDDNPHLTVTDKKLYEENGMLMGEIMFAFDNFDSLGFYRHKDCKCSPIMFYLGALSETFVESNGIYLGADRDLPFLIWDSKTREFYIKTSVLDDVSECHSLLTLYETWKGQ